MSGCQRSQGGAPETLLFLRSRHGRRLTSGISFIKFHSLLDGRAITEFAYRYSSRKTGYIICSFLLRSSPSSASGPSPEARKKEVNEILGAMQAEGIEGIDLSEDEFAKSHVRHLVGGRGDAKDERLFRFGELSSHMVSPLDERGC